MRARDNPFTVQRLAAVPYRLADTTWEDLLARLAALRFRAALVGPHGHGKTALLTELGRRLAERGFALRRASLHDGARRLARVQREELFRGLGRRDLLVVDGAEQLDGLAWLELRTRSRAAAGLLVTSHRPGLLPTLHECRSTPALLADLAAHLAGEPPADAAELHARHGGNLRDALWELYDRWAEGVTSRPAATAGSPPPRSR